MGVGPAFNDVLAVARLDATCQRGCLIPAVPLTPQQALDTAMANARWRIEKPTDYVTAFRLALGKYLLDKQVRHQIDSSFTMRDHIYFQTALNVLSPYWGCVEEVMRAAADASFVDSVTIDQLVDKADAACIEKRAKALQRIGFTGPDFHTFDYLADVGKPGGEVSSLLQHIQQFAVAYNVGLRGATWRNSIEVTMLPRSVPIR